MSDPSTSMPSGVPSPRLVASWERLGCLLPDRVPLWAAHWIAGGHDGPALVHLAGLHGDDPYEVHDALPEALMDCGVEIPDSDVAAATVAFTYAARLHVEGTAGPQWVVSQVAEIVERSGYSDTVMELPLGRLLGIDDEWGAGWGRSDEELAVVVREVCEEQLRVRE